MGRPLKFHDPVSQKMIGPLIAAPVLIVAFIITMIVMGTRDPLHQQRRYERFQLTKVGDVLNEGLSKDGHIPRGRYPADAAHLSYMKGRSQPLISSAPIYVDSDGQHYSLTSKSGAAWSKANGFTDRSH